MRLICALLILKLNLRCANILKLSDISLIFPVSSSLLRKCSRTSGSWSWSLTSSCFLSSSSSVARCGASLSPTSSGSSRILARPSWRWVSPWLSAPLPGCPSPSAAPSSSADLGLNSYFHLNVVIFWPDQLAPVAQLTIQEQQCDRARPRSLLPSPAWLLLHQLTHGVPFLWGESPGAGCECFKKPIWKLSRSGFNSSSLYLLAQQFWSLGFEAFRELIAYDCRNDVRQE